MVDIVKQAEEEFEDAQEQHSEARNDALADLKFARLGEQWDSKDIESRRRDGRPCLTINRLPAFIRQITNEARMNRPSIKVKPVDDNSDPETAEVLNGIIRNIEYSSNADIAYEGALDSAVSCSMGFFQVVTEYAHDDAFNQDIRIKQISNPLAVEYDPYGEEPDGSDWNYAFVLDYVHKDVAKKKWGKDGLVSFSADLIGDAKKDEDLIRIARYWKVSEEQRTLILFSDGMVMAEEDATKPHPDTGIPPLEMFAAMGIAPVRTRKAPTRKVKSYVLGGDVLEEADWAGKWIPVIPVFGEMVNVDGEIKLRSLVRDAKDPQKMFNYWRTTTTELVALAPKAPYIGPKGAFTTDKAKWTTANAVSWPYIEYDGPTPPQRQAFSGVPAGALQEALNAADDMKAIMGIYDASLGARSNETSGRAIMARQREGDVGTFHFIDNLSRSIRHCGRILVDLIPKVYDQPQVMRIIGVDGEAKNVKVNEEYTDEKTGMVKIHDLAAGKYDVAVDTGPSFTTRREEFVASVTEFIRGNPAVAPLIMDLVAKNMDWPEADEIAKRLKAMLPPQIQQMEAEEGLDPQAMMVIQTLQQQMAQLQQQNQMGAQEFQKVAQENASLKLQLQEKDVNLAIKDGELRLTNKQAQDKSGAEIVKANAEVAIADIEARAAERVAQVEAGVQSMASRLELLTTLVQTGAAREPVSVNVGDANKKPTRKVMQIQAPSGQVYTGVIEEEAIDA